MPLKEKPPMKNSLRLPGFLVLLLCVSGFTECYKPVTKNQLPTPIRTVADAAFQNDVLRYIVESRCTGAVMVELINRVRDLKVHVERECDVGLVGGAMKGFSFS